MRAGTGLRAATGCTAITGGDVPFAVPDPTARSVTESTDLPSDSYVTCKGSCAEGDSTGTDVSPMAGICSITGIADTEGTTLCVLTTSNSSLTSSILLQSSACTVGFGTAADGKASAKVEVFWAGAVLSRCTALADFSGAGETVTGTTAAAAAAAATAATGDSRPRRRGDLKGTVAPTGAGQGAEVVLGAELVVGDTSEVLASVTGTRMRRLRGVRPSRARSAATAWPRSAARILLVGCSCKAASMSSTACGAPIGVRHGSKYYY